METGRSSYDRVRRTLRNYLGGRLLLGFALAVLHLLFGEVKVGRVYWFDLDKERNLATWFSGVLFFLFGISAFVAYYWEQRRNSEGPVRFRLPILWLGIGFVGLYLSLDEITILHENLFWQEVRVASEGRGQAWRYLTQWQIVFGPAILIVMGYFALFFSNRFWASAGARRNSALGIGSWLTALLLEALRENFKYGDSYDWVVLVEEGLEMAGAVLLLAAVTSYTADIALDFTEERKRRLGMAANLLTRRAVAAVSIVVVFLLASAGTAFVLAQQRAEAGAPVPRLFERALATWQESGAAKIEDLPEVWFDEISAKSPLSPEDLQAATLYVAGALFGKQRNDDALLDAVRQDAAPRIVWVSYADAAGPARVVRGTGRGVGAALVEAVSLVEEGWIDADRIVWVQFDVAVSAGAERTDVTPPMPLERGLHGIAFSRASGLAFLPSEVLAHDLIDADRAIKPRRMLAYLNARNPTLGDRFLSLIKPRTPTPYRFFTTQGVFISANEATALYRGHRLFGEQIAPEMLLDAALAAGEYLIRSTRPDGTFVYVYQPATDTEDPTYNMLRHAGTIYSMLELYEVTEDPRLIEACLSAFDHLQRNIEPCLVNGEPHSCVVDVDSVKLGGNALAMIALSKYEQVTGDRRFRETAVELGRWIRAVQNEAGEFFIHKYSYPQGVISDFVSAYYPGEALLALSRLYELNGDEGLLDAAEAGARWLIEVRDGDVAAEDLNHDHWLLYALNGLYRHRSNPLYLEHALRIANTIVNGQNLEPRLRDWLGSYYKPPRSTPTAIRSEGLFAAYTLARDFGSPEEAQRILAAVRRGILFQLQTQLTAETVMHLQDPQRSLGAFRKSLTDVEIRIDYVQHNISALLLLYRELADE